MTKLMSGLLLVALSVVAVPDSFPGNAISEDEASRTYGLACVSLSRTSDGCTGCGPVCDVFTEVGTGESDYNEPQCFVGQQSCGTYHNETNCGFSS